MLTNKFSELEGIAWTTIGRRIKSDLNMSYQKLCKIEQKAFSLDNSRKFLESVKLLHDLEDIKTELIYIDEFNLQPRKAKFYGWAIKNSKPYMCWGVEATSYSFIAALSARKYYGIVWLKSTVNSEVFKDYLEELICNSRSIHDNEETTFALVCDNASYHKSLNVQEFLVNNKTKLITICPYWPWQNPVEFYINAIKEKVRQQLKLKK